MPDSQVATLAWAAPQLDAADVARCRAEYAEEGVTQFGGCTDGELREALLRFERDHRSEGSHRYAPPAQIDDTIAGGFDFHRIDYGQYPRSRATLEDKRRLRDLFDDQGISRIAAMLDAVLHPIVESVTGEAIRFVRPYLLVYREGGYIAPHCDAKIGNRINVQISALDNCVSALRVFTPGGIKLLHDSPGVVRILGPRPWHEVPPLLPVEASRPATRVLLTLRYDVPDKGGAIGAA
ncbi:MAG TPA: hypothetical protein VF230_14650 [Acidimicrobiales bacterium]